MPCRSEAPLVAIRKPAAARCPTTVGPVQPGRRVHGDADRLVDHHDRVVVVDDPDALDDLGLHLERVGQRRDRHLEQASRAPAGRSWPTAAPSRCDVALADQVGRAGAREPEHPGHRGVDPLPRQPLGHGAGPGGRPRSRGPRRARAALGSRPVTRAVEPDAAERLQQDQAGGDVDADVGDVEDRPVRQHEQVDDVPAQRTRVAQQPVGEVAGDAGRAAARGPRPRRRSPTRRANHSTTHSATIATRLKTTVNSVPVLNAAPGLRTRCSTNQSPSDLDVAAGQPVDGRDLGDQRRRRTPSGRRRRRARRARGAGGGVRGPFGLASLEVSDAPRAACMSCTVWHAGRP